MGEKEKRKRQIEGAYHAAQCRKRKVSTTRNGETLTFSSLKEASEKLNVPSSRICESCRQGIIVKGGYQFNYV